MKRTVILLLLILAFGAAAYAQMADKKGQAGPEMMPGPGMQGMGQEQQMPMMPMCQQMMQNMMKQQTATRDTMQMMSDIIKMQERIVEGPTGSAEKDAMLKELGDMRSKVSNMMAASAAASVPQTGTESQLDCAKNWLKQAMELHARHLQNPSTITDASQVQLMEEMRNAYQCLQGQMPPGPEGQAGRTGIPSESDHHAH